MVSDLISMAASNSKDFVKKKRGNRSAKLKQCKLVARREQWLSLVKTKENKEESEVGANPMRQCEEIKRSINCLEFNPIGDGNDGSMNNDSDSESLLNSPTSHISGVSCLNDSETNYAVSGGSSSSRSSRCECFSESMTEEEEVRIDVCLDDWEAVADALAEEEQRNPIPESPSVLENVRDGTSSGRDVPQLSSENVQILQTGFVHCRAWMPDDAFRPQSLPRLAKQLSFPMNSERHYGRGGTAWACKSIISLQSSCPICYEDLDVTDSSFLPCLCGFRLCLFCHKRILEGDGRCPGCRKQYERVPSVKEEEASEGGSLNFQLARSYSMVSRC